MVVEYAKFLVILWYVWFQPFVDDFLTGGGGGVVIDILGISPRTFEVAEWEIGLPIGKELLEGDFSAIANIAIF